MAPGERHMYQREAVLEAIQAALRHFGSLELEGGALAQVVLLC